MAPDDDALRQMKITRNTFQFNLRRRFEPIEHYRVKKSAETPLAQFLQNLKGEKKPFEGGGAEQGQKGARAPSSFPLKAILIASVVALLLFALIVAYVMVSASPKAAYSSPSPQKKSFSADFSQRVGEIGIVTYGAQDEKQYQAFLSTDFEAYGAKSMAVSARIFPTPPSRQIFILRYARNGADIYPEFRQKFEEYLAARGFSAVDISPSQVPMMPDGSTLVVPTGYLPSFLLDDARPGSKKFPPDSPVTPLLLSLAASGTNIVYLGDTFEFVMDPAGSVSPAEKKRLDTLGISFDTKAKPQPRDGLRMRVPLYLASSSSREIPSSTIYGAISDIKIGKGHLILAPENLDGGWPEDPQAAAEDIGRLVAEEPFHPPLAYAEERFGNSTPPNNSRAYLYLTPMKAQEGWLRLSFAINDSNDVQRQFFEDYFVKKAQNGDLYFPQGSTLTPEYLGGRRADILVVLREQSSGMVKLYFEIMANRTRYEMHELETGQTNPSLAKKSSLLTNVAPGRYFLRVVDPDGKLYAATTMDVVGVSVNGPHSVQGGTGRAFIDGSFNFSFWKDGQPAVVDYVKIYVEGAPATMRNYTKVSSISYRPNYDFKGSSGEGTPYNFVLDFGGFTQKFTYRRIVIRQFWDNIWVQILGAVAIIVAGIGFYLRRPEKMLFSLDIPDFPPMSIQKIPLNLSSVVAIFDQINHDYSWERMPLKPEELKGGFLKLTHNGKPIAVGDYNLERILERMEELGLTERALGYWGLTRWSKESGQGIERRAIFRRIRDLCVTNAIRFSKLDALPYCDLKLLIGQNEYFVHFFLGDYKVISSALETIPLGRSWILFMDSFALDEFKGHLQSSQSAPLALKMEIYNNRARLVTMDHLLELLKSLKIEG